MVCIHSTPRCMAQLSDFPKTGELSKQYLLGLSLS